MKNRNLPINKNKDITVPNITQVDTQFILKTISLTNFVCLIK